MPFNRRCTIRMMQVRNKLDIFISTNTYAVARTLLVVSHLSLFSLRPILPGEIGAAASWRLRKRCYEGSARAEHKQILKDVKTAGYLAVCTSCSDGSMGTRNQILRTFKSNLEDSRPSFKFKSIQNHAQKVRIFCHGQESPLLGC